MHVYKIEYRQYEYLIGAFAGRSDYELTPNREKHVMADNALDSVDLLRSDFRGHRIEIVSIEHVCEVDIKK